MISQRLSIITINYNNKEGLIKTIESVTCQTFKDFEYIVIDGGSSDGSKEIIEQYQEKISYWVSEPDTGIYNAMNKGILVAKGEFIQFLNSGDYLSEIDVLENVFSKIDDSDILYGDLYINDTCLNNIHKFPSKLDLNYFFNNSLGHPSMFLKKELFSKIGLFDESLKLVSDWKFYLQAYLLQCTFLHIHFPISVFILDGISSAESNKYFIKEERFKVLTSVLTNFQFDFPLFDKNYRNTIIADIYNLLSRISIFRKLLRKTITLLFRIKELLIQQTLELRRKINKVNILNYQNSKLLNPKEIPIIINNFNRLESLKLLIISLEKRGYFNLIILDNASSYPPLIQYYDQCIYKVIHLGNNFGHLAVWQADICKEYLKDYYVYTDSDVLPVEECPDNFMELFLNTLIKNPSITKVGFSLKIDDIPEHYLRKSEVLEWESQNFKNDIGSGLYLASIDTTFALYRPESKGDWNTDAIRTAFPFEARHLPWYEDEYNLSPEEIYYRKTKKTETGHWSGFDLKCN
jgi:glycosyltransferase involved in cell wall biosynthesis